MSTWSNTEPKICARCGATFRRTSDVSMANWKKRQYCSEKCGAQSRWERVRAAKRGGPE